VQGAKKVQGRSVFRHTLEFELFVATQQLGDLGQPDKTSYSPPLEQIPRLFALKGGNHALLITPNVHNVKRE
jgi:hypothetical protein